MGGNVSTERVAEPAQQAGFIFEIMD